MLKRPLVFLSAAPLALFAFAACDSDADPNLNSCGSIDVSGSATCEVQVDGGCVANCQPVNFVGECRGRCDATIDAQCTGGCQADCEAECNVDPPSFDCQASCQGSCESNCNAKCTGNSCAADCQAACQGECNASCSATGGSADCSAQCNASCDAECRVDANVDCNATCYGELQGGCTVACESPDGALYCDGQYVDAGNNLGECIAALEALLALEVDATASGVCDNDGCTASASATVSCAVSETLGAGERDALPWMAFGTALLGLGLVRRRQG